MKKETVKKTTRRNTRKSDKEFAFKKESIKIIPLGGLHEIGKNITVFEYGEDINFCSKCGNQLSTSSQNNSKKTNKSNMKGVAIVFAIVLLLIFIGVRQQYMRDNAFKDVPDLNEILEEDLITDNEQEHIDKEDTAKKAAEEQAKKEAEEKAKAEKEHKEYIAKQKKEGLANLKKIRKAYKSNSLSADDTYKGNRYVLYAELVSIDDGGFLDMLFNDIEVLVIYKDGNTICNAWCDFNDTERDKLKKYKKGDYILFSGVCYSAGNFSDCEIIE